MNINIIPEEIDFDKHLIVDIRTKEEQEQVYLKDSILYPIEFSDVDENKVLNYFEDLAKGEKQIVLMCASGYRSEILCNFLNRFKKIALNLDGGISTLSEVFPEKIISK